MLSESESLLSWGKDLLRFWLLCAARDELSGSEGLWSDEDGDMSEVYK